MKRLALIALFLLIMMPPVSAFAILQGDIDNNGNVDLKDAIMVLQLFSGIDVTNPVYVSADVNGDGKIGMAEVIYTLQCLARLRNNHAPALNAIGNKTVDEGALLTFKISATDTDRDTPTYSATNLPSGASIDEKSGAFSWVPTFVQSDTYAITFVADDGYGGTDSETITITVNNVNGPPILNTIGDKTVDEGSLLNFSISATDPDGDILTYTVPNLAIGATFNETSRTFSWTPTYAQSGIYQITFIVSDNYGGSASETIHITVNDAMSSSGNLIADTAASFWASGNEAKWSYQMVDRRSGANQEPILKTVDDLGEVVIAGKVVHRFDHSWSLSKPAPETEYHYFDGREIRTLELLSIKPGVVLPMDYADVPAPLREGETTKVVDRTEQIDVNNDGFEDQSHFEARVTLATEPSLSVPAGEFRGLLRSRQELTVTFTNGWNNQITSATGVVTTWYAPGIGVVRQVYEDPTRLAPNNTVTEELAGVGIGSTRAGIVPNITALDALGAGNDSGTPGPVDFAVGGGRIMTVTTSQAGTVEGVIHDGNGSLVWRGTVLLTSKPYVLGGAAVAFDGTDFRVVTCRTIPYNSPTEYALISQRITTGGVLRDGLTGSLLDSGIPDASQTLGGLRAAARQGRLLISWGRYDTTYVPFAPGLVTQRGYVIEGRMYNAQQQPVAERFELGSGLPEALTVRDDQYIVINTSQNGAVSTLNSWAIDINGVPVSIQPYIVSNTPFLKYSAKLQMVGNDLWLSYHEGSGSEWVMPPTKLVTARLGRDGTLLDGTADAPGYTLLQTDSARGTGTLVIGAARSLLAWSEGWNTLRATLFDNSALTGASILPSTFISLVPNKPNSNGAEPSRSIVMGTDIGKALMVGWIDNEQSVTTQSDRIMFTLIYPRLAP